MGVVGLQNDGRGAGWRAAVSGVSRVVHLANHLALLAHPLS